VQEEREEGKRGRRERGMEIKRGGKRKGEKAKKVCNKLKFI